jgi:hypothetical protein
MRLLAIGLHVIGLIFWIAGCLLCSMRQRSKLRLIGAACCLASAFFDTVTMAAKDEHISTVLDVLRILIWSVLLNWEWRKPPQLKKPSKVASRIAAINGRLKVVPVHG